MVDQRRVALLDLGDVFVGVFSDLTEALVALLDEGMDSDLPSVLADGFGLEALDRIWKVIGPTQELTGTRLVSADRRTQYQRVSFVELDVDDLTAVGDAVQALGAGLLIGQPQITDLLVTFADAAPPEAAGGKLPWRHTRLLRAVTRGSWTWPGRRRTRPSTC
jgi:hypothetical protein